MAIQGAEQAAQLAHTCAHNGAQLKTAEAGAAAAETAAAAAGAETGQPLKCSAVHTLERDLYDHDWSHLVPELRSRLNQWCRDNPGLFAQADLDKCNSDDWHLSRYLLRQKLDLEAALEMLTSAMRFMHENIVRAIRPQDFPREFYRTSGLFRYQPDRKGNKTLFIRAKVHRKLPELQAVVEAFILHNILAVDAEAEGRGIAIVIDCQGAGLANADMETLLYMISTLKSYFPKGLSYFLVHDLPWILKPVWYIARGWVAEEHRQLIQFSDPSTICEFIERQNLPDFMGGTCERDYRQPPEHCTTLRQAAKMWGIEPQFAKKVLHKFADFLDPQELQQALQEFDHAHQEHSEPQPEPFGL